MGWDVSRILGRASAVTFLRSRGKLPTPRGLAARPSPTPYQRLVVALAWINTPAIAYPSRGIWAIQRLKITNATDGLGGEQWLRVPLKPKRRSSVFGGRLWLALPWVKELCRVNLAAVAKVIQDGFLNHRDAFHLLVPNRPLGELFGSMTEKRCSGTTVSMCDCVPGCSPSFQNQIVELTVFADEFGQISADAVIIAVPWFRINDLIADLSMPEIEQLGINAPLS